MNPKLRKIIKKFGPLVNLLVILVLLGFIWIEVHWSVALMMAWMAYSISAFATGLNKFRHEFLMKVRDLTEDQLHITQQFNQFIDTVNRQAEEFKSRGTKCIECEKYPGQIRNGSIHNSADPNCQMHNKVQLYHPSSQLRVPPDVLEKDDRPSCRKCQDEGYPDIYKHNNCPIHN